LAQAADGIAPGDPRHCEGRMSQELSPVEIANLPSLVARAGQRLLDARSSAEVLEAKKIAEAALHYAKVTSAANDTHADCLRIITRAEMRMADEIDRGQERGDVKPAHRTVQGSDSSSYDDLGIDRRRVAEWRETRDAGPEVVEEAITEALDEGRAPTKADIAKRVRATSPRTKSKADWAKPVAPTQTQHDRDLEFLNGAWNAACPSARAAFLRGLGYTPIPGEAA